MSNKQFQFKVCYQAIAFFLLMNTRIGLICRTEKNNVKICTEILNYSNAC